MRKFFKKMLQKNAQFYIEEGKSFNEITEEDIHKDFLTEKYDYIILNSSLGEIEDIQLFFRKVRKNCHEDTRLIIIQYNRLWKPFIKFLELFHLKHKGQFISWPNIYDTQNFLFLEDFEIVKKERSVFLPFRIPLISAVINNFFSRLPLLNRLGLVDFIVARPLKIKEKEEKSVSIIIPARNEEGNIENAITGIPDFGFSQEIIFIEGGSKDNTAREIERVIKKYSEKNIKYFTQTGKGKYDAVKLGFEHATGDILMILDADLTVVPDQLPKFYCAIVENKGEFINGSRLYYPMGKHAMPKFNHFGNVMFARIFSYLLSQKISDTLCGTKVLTKHNYERIKQGRKYFGDFDPFGDFDLLLGATKLNLKIIDLPIHYQDRTYGSTNISSAHHGPILAKMSLFAMRKLKFGR